MKREETLKYTKKVHYLLHHLIHSIHVQPVLDWMNIGPKSWWRYTVTLLDAAFDKLGYNQNIFLSPGKKLPDLRYFFLPRKIREGEESACAGIMNHMNHTNHIIDLMNTLIGTFFLLPDSFPRGIKVHKIRLFLSLGGKFLQGKKCLLH